MHVPAHEIRIAALEEENERLRQQVEDMRADAKADPLEFPRDWGLTPQERSVLSLLMATEWASRRRILAHLPRKSAEAESENIVSVLIATARGKLSRFGIKIETLHGEGFLISPAAKDLIRRLSEAAA